MGIPKEVVIIATTHENTKMIDEVYLHVSSHDKAHKLSEAIIEKTQGSMFVAHKEQVSPKPEVDVFNLSSPMIYYWNLPRNTKRLKYMRSWIKIWTKGF